MVGYTRPPSRTDTTRVGLITGTSTVAGGAGSTTHVADAVVLGLVAAVAVTVTRPARVAVMVSVTCPWRLVIA
jgi:hypothetical protein